MNDGPATLQLRPCACSCRGACKVHGFTCRPPPPPQQPARRCPYWRVEGDTDGTERRRASPLRRASLVLAFGRSASAASEGRARSGSACGGSSNCRVSTQNMLCWAMLGCPVSWPAYSAADDVCSVFGATRSLITSSLHLSVLPVRIEHACFVWPTDGIAVRFLTNFHTFREIKS